MEKTAPVLGFLDSQAHMVIATCGKSHTPEAALVGFAFTQDLILIFGTTTTSKKYKNIVDNPKVAVVFGKDEKITIQYEGVVSELTSDESIKYKELYFQKTPTSKKYENKPDQIYFKIVPTWIRYTDYNKKPNEIFEITF